MQQYINPSVGMSQDTPDLSNPFNDVARSSMSGFSPFETFNNNREARLLAQQMAQEAYKQSQEATQTAKYGNQRLGEQSVQWGPEAQLAAAQARAMIGRLPDITEYEQQMDKYKLDPNYINTQKAAMLSGAAATAARNVNDVRSKSLYGGGVPLQMGGGVSLPVSNEEAYKYGFQGSKLEAQMSMQQAREGLKLKIESGKLPKQSDYQTALAHIQEDEELRLLPIGEQLQLAAEWSGKQTPESRQENSAAINQLKALDEKMSQPSYNMMATAEEKKEDQRRRQELIQTTSRPPQPVGKGMLNQAQFPKVDQATQKSRDSNRMAILTDEFSKLSAALPLARTPEERQQIQSNLMGVATELKKAGGSVSMSQSSSSPVVVNVPGGGSLRIGVK